MPWQGVSPVDLRMRFVTEYLTEHFSMTELAASYGTGCRVCRRPGWRLAGVFRGIGARDLSRTDLAIRIARAYAASAGPWLMRALLRRLIVD